MTNDSSDDDFAVLNKVQSEIGVGRHQVLILLLICLPAFFVYASCNNYIFTARDTSYRCAVPECESSPPTYNESWIAEAIPFEDATPVKCVKYAVLNKSIHYNMIPVSEYSTCDLEIFDVQKTEKCSEWIYEEGRSIVADYGIPCQEWKLSLVGSVNSVGLLVSLLYTGAVSDRYGRKVTMVTVMFLAGVFGFAQSFAPTYWVFFALEFLTNAFGAGSYSIAYILSAETLPPTKRIYGCAIVEASASLGIASIGIFAWVTPTWREMLRIIHVPLLMVPTLMLILPESLRWLYVRGKIQVCVDNLTKSAKINRIKLSANSMIDLKIMASASNYSIKNIQRPAISLGDVLKSSRLCTRLMLCSYCFFTTITVYNGLSINSVNILDNGSNIYALFTLIALADLPSAIIFLLLLKFSTRKTGLFVAYVTTGLFCTIYALVPNLSYVANLVIYVTSKVFVQVSSLLINIFISEVFPTVVRNTCFNFCNVFGSIGGIVAPQILLLKNITKPLPLVTYGVLALVAALIITRCPESKDKNLPDTIEEAEEL